MKVGLKKVSLGKVSLSFYTWECVSDYFSQYRETGKLNIVLMIAIGGVLIK